MLNPPGQTGLEAKILA